MYFVPWANVPHTSCYPGFIWMPRMTNIGTASVPSNGISESKFRKTNKKNKRCLEETRKCTFINCQATDNNLKAEKATRP